MIFELYNVIFVDFEDSFKQHYFVVTKTQIMMLIEKDKVILIKDDVVIIILCYKFFFL